MPGKIGFFKQTDSKPEKPNLGSDEQIFQELVQKRYAQGGLPADMVFRTSRELAYEFREMVCLSLPSINRLMEQMHYRGDIFMGQSTWVLYEREPPSYP